ncbi:MAG TPA: hypothetical protein DHV26_03620 [Cytophagales bacterium]|nr:hypothetical protein [Flavobacterium sp.]HCZ34995.1 hypothetical protein [Cytophagales bacterium]
MKIIIALIFIFSACSCTKNKQPRYIVIGTGDIPTFLDTETREVYSIQTYDGSAPDVYKTSLEKANK